MRESRTLCLGNVFLCPDGAVSAKGELGRGWPRWGASLRGVSALQGSEGLVPGTGKDSGGFEMLR